MPAASRISAMSLAIDPGPPPLVPKARGAKRNFVGSRAIIALVLREMATTYGRSPGGYLWALLEPVAGILLMTAVFSIAFRSPPLGVNFPLFYATGMVPFLVYSSIVGKMGSALNFSRPLLAYPTVTFADALLARFLINFMTQIMVAYLIFAGILLMYETRAIIDGVKLIQAFAMAGALAFGVGVMNCFLISVFPVWQSIWSILNRPMFIISGIFFIFESIPQPYRDYLWFNPIVHIVGLTRSGFYPSYEATYVSQLYVYGVSLCLTAMGLLLLKRHYRNLMDR